MATNDVSRIMPQLEDTMKISVSDDVGIEYFENLNNHIVEMTTKEVRIPFLWKTWDMYTYGGIPENEGCLFVIMAQPGLGKSQMMMNIGYNWLMQDKNVLMVSLEMSQKMYSARMDALFADIGVNEIKDNTDKLAKKVGAIKLAHPHSRLQIKQYSPNEFNANKLKNLLEKLEKTKGFKPDLIIVDYLNIMGTNGPSYGMKLYERIGMITKELRAVSVETKIPILTATQANRCVLNTSLVTVYRNNKEVVIPIKDVEIGDMIKVDNNTFNKIEDKFEQQQETYEITLKSGKKIVCSANHIFPTNEGELTIQTGLKKGIRLHSVNNNNNIFYNDQIVSIKPVGKNKTVDITTDGNHLFLANDILTHNSSGGYAADDSISMDNTSESSAINMDADCLFALFQGKGDRQSGILHVKILKNRLGGFVDRTFIMTVDYTTLKITQNDGQIENDLSEELGEDFAVSNSSKEIDDVLEGI